ncbi:MAG: response regulator [Chitinophagales bacterium]
MNKNAPRISIVENTRNWNNYFKQLPLTNNNICLISTYTNAEDAVKKIHHDKPDIVVMAIDLPQMNGIECMIRILKKSPHISFLIFTTHENNKHIFKALKGGASGYILKKDGNRGLIEGVEELVAGGFPMSRSIARKVLKSFRPTDQLIEKISPREREVLHLLSKGFLYKEIAEELNPQINLGTVKQHVHRIYKKLEVNNRTEAINKYLGYR